MDNAMIGKIEKAKLYASEPERITFNDFVVDFQGDNNTYTLTLNAEGWHCTCPGYQKTGVCPHIMTMERLLEPMLKRSPVPYSPGQNVVSDVQKAKRYAAEPNRVRFTSFGLTFNGDNGNHQTAYSEGRWECSCGFFHSRGVCCHTMAMERVLGQMIPARPEATAAT